MKLIKPKIGIFFVLAYLVLAAIAFVAHIYSVKTNLGDSGESMIPFYILALPWAQLMTLLPSSLVYSKAWGLFAYPILWLMISLNAFIIYCLMGRISFRNKK